MLVQMNGVKYDFGCSSTTRLCFHDCLNVKNLFSQSISENIKRLLGSKYLAVIK